MARDYHVAGMLRNRMSRSEHATRRSPRDHGDLPRKRRIKWLSARERRAAAHELPPVDPGSIAIVVRDRGPYVHYPASADDVRAILHRVPPGAVDGIGTIELDLYRAA